MKPSKLTLVITFILIFWFSLQPAIDPDTGWHIATGRYIVEQKSIPQTDPFSFSLPNHPYIAHSWGIDIIMYEVDKLAGPVGLSILFALLTTAFFAITYSTINHKSLIINHPFWLLLIAYPAIEIIGTRPQVITVIGLAWLLRLLTRPLSSRHIWQIPLGFFIWANLHGGVVLGLVTYGLWLGLSFLLHTYKPVHQIHLLGLVLLSSAATLLNPYTFHLFTFSWGMITNSTSMVYNSDWVPLFSGRLGDDSLIVRLIIVAGSLIAIFDQKKSAKTLAFLAGGFLLLAFKSLRFLVPLLPVVTLLVSPMLQKLAGKLTTHQLFFPAVGLVVFSLTFSVLSDKSDVFCSRRPECYAKLAEMPFGAVDFMANHHLSGRVFNFYTWGGYLSWQIPGSQVFIDGRMDNFFVGKKSFLTEFVAIEEQHKGWYDRLMSYRPQLAIIPVGWQVQQQSLILNGWQNLYQDNVAILMQAP